MIHLPDSVLYVPEGHFEQVDEPAIESSTGSELVANLKKNKLYMKMGLWISKLRFDLMPTMCFIRDRNGASSWQAWDIV